MTTVVWANWADFVAMGGYRGYVWGAFGATAAAIVAETVGIALRRRALRLRGPVPATTAEWQA